MRDQRLLLEDILLRTERLISVAETFTREQFDSDWQVREAALRCIEIIGEASKSLPEEVREDNPHIPWRKIMRTRDVLAHAYFGIRDDVIWQIISEEAAVLDEQVREILGQLAP